MKVQPAVAYQRGCVNRLLLFVLLFAVTALTNAFAAQSAAQIAVDAAKKYAGTTITVEWQAGLQALDPLNFSGPLWERLTGIKIKVVEVPLAEAFSKIMLDYRSGSGGFDVVDVVPSWMPDLAQAGALEPLDAYVDRYGCRERWARSCSTRRDNRTGPRRHPTVRAPRPAPDRASTTGPRPRHRNRRSRNGSPA